MGMSAPDVMPVLSRGKHRNPRKGACFMELVSFVAGEPWSDHPACTHPLLGSLARLVNDHTSDAARPRLAPLIPSVIGLTTDDPQLDVRIALRAATTALPVAPAERQRVLAVGVLVANRVLDDRAADGMRELSREALASAPHATQWAQRFANRSASSAVAFRRHGAPTVVRGAVEGIAEACISNVDEMLHDLLAAAIEDCEGWVRRTSAEARPLDAEDWAALRRLTGAAPAL